MSLKATVIVSGASSSAHAPHLCSCSGTLWLLLDVDELEVDELEVEDDDVLDDEDDELSDSDDELDIEDLDIEL